MAPKRAALFGVPLGQWLAVFPIIAIVCAVLYPVFQKIKENTGPRCISNLMQLGLAYVQYEQDADGHLPSGINTSGNGWAGQLFPYNRYSSVYICPRDLQSGNYISYAENQNIVGWTQKEFADPPATVELYEATTLHCDPSTLETVSATGLSAPANSTRHDSPQYPFALNFLLADGHVKMLTPGQIASGPNAVPPKHKGLYAATFAIR